MPLLGLKTNISVQNKSQIARQLSESVASLLGKPESYVMVTVEDQQTILFAGNNDPAALVHLKSLGLPEDRTSEMSDRICSLIADNTGIPPDRIYIEFASPARHMWGWDSHTFG